MSAGRRRRPEQHRLIGQCVDVYLPLNPAEEAALAAEVAQLPVK